jgi:Homeodomain-like domain
MANREASPSLETKRYIAIQHLACGKTLTEAARSVGVTAKTIGRWLHDPVFVAELNARRSELWSGMTDKARRALSMALDVYLARLTNGDDAAARDVLRAFGSTLSQGLADLGPTDPDEIRRRLAHREEIRRLTDSMREQLQPREPLPEAPGEGGETG